MLRIETVEPHTFSVLNKLMQMPELKDFALVGGTALSVPQAITYFADADESEDPISLQNQTWEDIQKVISLKVSEYLR